MKRISHYPLDTTRRQIPLPADAAGVTGRRPAPGGLRHMPFRMRNAPGACAMQNCSAVSLVSLCLHVLHDVPVAELADRHFGVIPAAGETTFPRTSSYTSAPRAPWPSTITATSSNCTTARRTAGSGGPPDCGTQCLPWLERLSDAGPGSTGWCLAESLVRDLTMPALG